MTERASMNEWVEIHGIVLEPGERASAVPDDTQKVALEMRVKGFLMHAAEVGERAEIITPAGRRVAGTLSAINPPYEHAFGSPIPELSAIGGEVRAILGAKGSIR